MISPFDVAQANARLETATPAEILAWAVASFPGSLAATSSFQTQSVPLLHLLSRFASDVPVLFLDTGYHFPETLAFRDRIARDLGLQVRDVRPDPAHLSVDPASAAPYEADPDRCCFVRKVLPLRSALAGFDAWITGIRRDQTRGRSDTPIVQIVGGKVKICPVANWTDRDVRTYLDRNGLPEHPLFAQGYPSIGCAPCTAPALSSDDARSGRWTGTAKTECGLHLPSPRGDEGH